MKQIVVALSFFVFCFSSLFGEQLVEMYKDPNCGCCKKWGSYMETNGYKVKTINVKNSISIKDKFNVPLEISSCHTAIIDGYVVEGHVPAAEVEALLKMKPKDVIGIAVPGMPLGSPGMEQGNVLEDYEVLAFKKDGSYYIFSVYEKGKFSSRVKE